MNHVIDDIKALLPIEELYENHLLAKNNIKQARDTDGAFHPSQMGGCTRKLWYAACMFQPRHRIDAKLRCTFNHGHAVHDWQQSELGLLLANLNDNREGITYSAKFEVSLNDEDEARPFTTSYDDLEGENSCTYAEEFNIAGSADGLITIADANSHVFGPKRIIYELKTMADASWKKLTKPQVKHISQATIYANCLDADVILFQYYNKNADVSKWFWVAPDEDSWQRAISQIETVRVALSDGTEVPAEFSMWECKSCGYYSDCRPEQR